MPGHSSARSSRSWRSRFTPRSARRLTARDGHTRRGRRYPAAAVWLLRRRVGRPAPAQADHGGHKPPPRSAVATIPIAALLDMTSFALLVAVEIVIGLLLCVFPDGGCRCMPRPGRAQAAAVGQQPHPVEQLGRAGRRALAGRLARRRHRRTCDNRHQRAHLPLVGTADRANLLSEPGRASACRA